MEIHKNLSIDSKYKISVKSLDVLTYFEKALEFTKMYYSEDFDRISTRKFADLTLDQFFQEYIWCVYTSGFNAKIVSKFFPKLMTIYEPLFRHIHNRYVIPDDEMLQIYYSAVKVCANKRKVSAVFKESNILSDSLKHIDWKSYKERHLFSPDKLTLLPFIGPTTCYHLARNIGLLDFVKPDLHLVRMADHWKFTSCEDMCKHIQKSYDLPLGVIDLVLWYAASTFGTNDV